MFQHTAARRRLADSVVGHPDAHLVSTHSRPKAAGSTQAISRPAHTCFNTQPPEGGWFARRSGRYRFWGFNTQPPEGGWQPAKPTATTAASFNTQPPEGGWPVEQPAEPAEPVVSTHSRPKAAGKPCLTGYRLLLFQHTAARRRLAILRLRGRRLLRFQHTAARRRLAVKTLGSALSSDVSTHSRPKAAGLGVGVEDADFFSFNTQPPEGGWHSAFTAGHWTSAFQHTAARRRLAFPSSFSVRLFTVSTHSRPKAAGFPNVVGQKPLLCFNTQPPEGGWLARVFGTEFGRVSTHSRPKAAGQIRLPSVCYHPSFNTQPPEGGWVFTLQIFGFNCWFQHTAARRRLVGMTLNQAYEQMFQHTAARRRLVGMTLNQAYEQMFQHTAARRRLASETSHFVMPIERFNTQPPEGGWEAADTM